MIHVIAIVQFCHVRAGTVQHNQSKTSQKNDNREKTVIIIIGFLFYFWFSYNCFFSTHSIQYSRLLSRPQEKNRETIYNPFPCFYHDFLFVTVIIDCCCFNNKFYVSAHIIFFSTEGMICIVIRADRIQTIQDILQIIIYKI